MDDDEKLVVVMDWACVDGVAKAVESLWQKDSLHSYPTDIPRH